MLKCSHRPVVRPPFMEHPTINVSLISYKGNSLSVFNGFRHNQFAKLCVPLSEKIEIFRATLTSTKLLPPAAIIMELEMKKTVECKKEREMKSTSNLMNIRDHQQFPFTDDYTNLYFIIFSLPSARREEKMFQLFQLQLDATDCVNKRALSFWTISERRIAFAVSDDT